MISPKPMCFCLATMMAALSVQAQGTFQNLNFEQANPVIVAGSPYYPYGVTVASALPDLTATIGPVQLTQITQNDPTLGGPWVMLVGPGFEPGYAPIDGYYSVMLQGTFDSSLPAISQTGLITAGTQSLLFEAQPGSRVISSG